MTTDVSKLSYAELVDLKNRLDEEIASKKVEEIKVLADGYVKKAQAAGFTAAEALEAVRPYVPARKALQASARVRYQDPLHPENGWSGRGRAPRWMVAYEEQGRLRSEFKVDES